MASIGRQRRSRIGTVRSARLVSATLVALGTLALLALALSPLLPLIPSLAPTPVGGTEAETALRPLLGWLGDLPEPDWPVLVAGVSVAALMLWLGYVLRVLAVIAETQLIDLDTD